MTQIFHSRKAAAFTLLWALAVGIGVYDPPQSAETAPADDGGSYTVILYDAEKGTTATLDMEEYLVGVIAAEMPASYEPEALKAQAVAARSYTLYTIEHGGCSSSEGQVCTSSACCQAYLDPGERSSRWGKDAGFYEEKLRSAIASTEGEVITYNGQVANALFHAVSGGMTEDAREVWGGSVAYLVPVESPGEEGASKYSGTVEVSAAEFAAAVNAHGANITADDPAGAIGDIRLTSSGRVAAVTIGSREFTGGELRSIFGLNSANFTLSYENGNIIFSTLGYGHGVGMSQAGANAMAKYGKNYKDILTHYYTDVEIVPISSMM